MDNSKEEFGKPLKPIPIPKSECRHVDQGYELTGNKSVTETGVWEERKCKKCGAEYYVLVYEG